jgi:hypothetical protein
MEGLKNLVALFDDVWLVLLVGVVITVLVESRWADLQAHLSAFAASQAAAPSSAAGAAAAAAAAAAAQAASSGTWPCYFRRLSLPLSQTGSSPPQLRLMNHQQAPSHPHGMTRKTAPGGTSTTLPPLPLPPLLLPLPKQSPLPQ